MRKKALLNGVIFLMLIQAEALYSQDNYHLNGSASKENCNCYTITSDEFYQSGSVWNINKIDLSQSFRYNFNVNLGCRDIEGADGQVFVLQPINTSSGTQGSGLGFRGISPSIGIAIDTWYNPEDNDPDNDHLSIHRNGDIDHKTSNNLAGPLLLDNIEDCKWHLLVIDWNAITKHLMAVIDSKDTVQITIDLVNDVFGGDPEVFWGFTASTGFASNHQRFCTSLNPAIMEQADGTVTCFPTPIQFSDSSVSFGDIVKWYWDFGDGTKDSAQTPALHVYPAAGIYEVQLRILANDGCLSDTFRRQIIVGSEPKVQFGYNSTKICEKDLVVFTDSSTVEFGNIKWRIWNLVGQSKDTTLLPGYSYQFGSDGSFQTELTVQTKEGCESGPVSKTIDILPAPDITINSMDACVKEIVNFSASNLNPSTLVSQWYWNLGDGNIATTSTVRHFFEKVGTYNIRLATISSEGCKSDTIINTVTIYDTKAYAGKDTSVAAGDKVQLRASGGISYKWSPATGLSNPDIFNPIATVQADIKYVLTAFTPAGCATTDTVQLKSLKGPAIYIPNAFTPNNDGKNDRFRFIPVSMKEVYYFRVYNRFGQMIYSAKTAEPGWDGLLDGKQQPAGTYVWMLSAKDYNDHVQTLRGTVVLVR